MFQHILIPLDGSTFGEQALGYATTLARQFNATITLCHVILQPQGAPMLAAEASELTSDIENRALTSAVEYLESKAAVLRATGLTVNLHTAQSNSVPQAILDAIRTENADTVVMSTHGHTGLGRWMFGSVAERVVRHSPVPVLLVRPQ